ncbi:cadmium-translocating P-type ATPase [Candidatus Woesearchaeota archaeon]|nr:cadmium-translocating P-type ATPase [Candidatus Woesearchaeota archaeon]
MKKTKIQISGMHCASCENILDRALRKTEGIKEVNVSFANSNAVINYDEKKASESNILKVIEKSGYKGKFLDSKQSSSKIQNKQLQEEKNNYKRLFYIGLIFAIPAFLIGMVLPMLGIEVPYMGYILWFLATPVQFYVGWQFYLGAYHALKNKNANMDTLIVLGTTTAYLFSTIVVFFGLNQSQYFETSAILITLVMMGKYLEALAKGKTSEAIKKLIQLSPKNATIIQNGKEIKIPVDEIQVNHTIVIKPGEKIAVDGIIIEGSSSIDESMVTGESIPVEKKKGDTVISGTINKQGYFKFKATKVGENTTLARIIKLIEDAQSSKANIQRVADVISSYFVPTVIIISAITFFVWYVLLGLTLSFSMIAAVAVLVIACPCALGLATPTAIMVGTGIGAENGILIRGGEALETAHKIKSIIFDKTGTITKGIPEVTNVTNEKVLEIAACLEMGSEHPLADAITKSARTKKLKIEKVTNFKSITGHGIIGKIKTKSYLLGNRKLMAKEKINLNQYESEAKQLEEEGKTVMFLATNKELLGIIAVADTLKESSIEAVTKLKKLGLEVYMITGDNERTARAIAKKVGIENVFSDVLPEDKANYVKKLQKQGKVAMVGDGINDAPALAQADIGIAMGSGTDVAMETGSIVLMKNDLLDVPKAIALSKNTIGKIKQNMFWALIYNVIGIPIAAGILYPYTGWLLSPIIAGGAMALSSVSVVSNSLLLKFKKL